MSGYQLEARQAAAAKQNLGAMSQMSSACPAMVFGQSEILPAEPDDSPVLSPDMDRLATWMTMMEVTGCILVHLGAQTVLRHALS